MTHIFCCISVGLAVDINLSIYFYNAEKSNHSKQLPSFGINHNQDFWCCGEGKVTEPIARPQLILRHDLINARSFINMTTNTLPIIKGYMLIYWLIDKLHDYYILC